MKLFLLLLFCHMSSSVKHSLKFIFTVPYGVQTLPEMVAVGMVDEVVMAYCDSHTKAGPKQDWMEKISEVEPEHMKWYNQQCAAYGPILKTYLATVMLNLNQSGGVHTLQWLSGCEWDDETQDVKGFRKCGYDGEDFLEFEVKTATWIASSPHAESIKTEWDNNADNGFWKNFYDNICPKFLKKYLDYGKSTLLRTELPSVSLLQKTPSSPITCHATGFYPDRAWLFWTKDGEELHEDVYQGEVLSNHDGTFQMSVDMPPPSDKPEDWGRYECVFQFSGVKEHLTTKLERAAIRTNQIPPSEFPKGAVVGTIIGLLLLVICISALLIWRRRSNGFRPANTADNSSSLDKATT